MTHTRNNLFAAALVLALMLPVAPAIAEETGLPYCDLTARMALRGCNYDNFSGFWEAHAGCINLPTIDGRRTCREETVAARLEGREECEDQFDARTELCEELGGFRYLPDFVPENFEDPDAIGVPNPYLSLAAGGTSVIEAEDGEELVVTYVTDQSVEIEGVKCRTVVDVAFIVGIDEEDGEVDYIPLEITDDWYAQHINGDVWYCGELSRNYEDGIITDLDGSFVAGTDGALAGTLIPAAPVPGDYFRQEFFVNEAEDVIEIISLASGPAEEVDGFECNGGCLETRDFTPLSPDEEEAKYYLPGVGFVLAVAFEDGEEADREELLCHGDSLAVLDDEACGIADVAELLEELCELDPDTFCDDDDDPQTKRSAFRMQGN